MCVCVCVSCLRVCVNKKIGRHGVRMEYRCPDTRAHFAATFLPEVAADQAWTKHQTVQALLRKSGYLRGARGGGGNGARGAGRGGRGAGSVPSPLSPQQPPDFDTSALRITRYQSRKCSAHYYEYLEWKKSGAIAAASTTTASTTATSTTTQPHPTSQGKKSR